MSVPFLDLRAIYRQIESEVRPELEEVLESCRYVLGPKVSAFEDAFAETAGTSRCIAVSSGTAAVHLMLWASGMPEGSGVVVPPNTFTATLEGVILAGYVPVFADVDEGTWNLSPSRVRELLESGAGGGEPVDRRTGARIRAILSVDLYGQPAENEELEAIAREHGLMLFEDACQAHDAERGGRRAGSYGRAAAFSFYPGKNLGAFGEGGAVTTDDAELADAIVSMRDHGSREKYYYERIGHNYRMAAFQGAVLGVKVRYIREWNDQRIEAAARYGELLSGTPLELPVTMPGTRHVFHLYAAHTPRRDRLREYLSGRGVASGLHYPLPLHVQEAYAHLGYSEGDFPRAERNARENITLPIFPGITAEQQEEVAEAVSAFFGGTG